MPPAVDSFYWFCLNRYRKGRVLLRDDRAFAADYGVSKNTVTRWVRFLETHGWLVPQRAGRSRVRNKTTGMFLPIAYDVIEHDVWAASHPDTCRYLGDPVPIIGTGRSDKSPKKQASSRMNGRKKSARQGVESPDSHQSLKWGLDQSLFCDTTSPYNRDIKRSKNSSSKEVENKHDTEPPQDGGIQPCVFSSKPQTNENLQGQDHHRADRAPSPSPSPKRSPGEALLDAARVLPLRWPDHGVDGAGLAALIASTCLNNPDGDGRLPRDLSYYTKAADSFNPDEPTPFDGYLDGGMYEDMPAEGIDRLRRAADRHGLDLDYELSQLAAMQKKYSEVAA